MKVRIDSKKISSSTNIKNSGNSNAVVDGIKEQLLQQLLFGNNSSFLISGYRGTGKTTLIKQMEEEINDKNYIFVHLNISKYEEYSLILRKLIREIYLTLSSSEIYKQIKNKKLINNIELLYEHTFYEIFSNLNIKNLKEFESKLERSFNLKDIVRHLLPLLAVLTSSLNMSFNIFPSLLEYSDVGLLALSICWFIIDGFKFKLKMQKGRSSVEELNRKSLYDDEIAEYHLRNMLEELKEEGIKIIFVFDELDKIENETDMANVISDLKPLLLSDLASFIVISGQKLYYKFINSSVLDDSIMTSIFAKNIHIPLTTNIELEKLFNSYVIDSNINDNELVKNYRDSLILNSYRTMRRFNNLILQDIEWNKNVSYLYIDEANLDSYKTDSLILDKVTQIIETIIDSSDYDNGVKDFLTFQLFIWVKKMKLKANIYFTNEEVYNFEEDYSEQYPVWTRYQLNEICNELISELLNVDLLEKKSTKDDEEIYYRWTTQANIKIDGISNDQSQVKIKFLEGMIDIEKYCRDILIDLEGNNQQYNKRSLLSLVKSLVSIGVIRDRWLSKKNKELYILSNKIRHGETLSIKEVDEIIQNSNYIRSLIRELIEGYCFYVINSYLRGFGYNVYHSRKHRDVYNSIYQFDIAAENNKLADIIFEIKYRNISSSNDINTVYRLIKLIKEYNSKTHKKNKLVIFWFSKESRKAFEKFKDSINRIIINEYNELQGDIYLFYASEHRTHFSTGRMTAYLDKVIQSSLSGIENEIAATVDGMNE
ncbi:ATP-binding protein [Bacillus haynesii]|uniref:ATP-binding protein n=1 Tax=Bacillus haynesii TaxID=1925021 RepID=UPI00227E66C3|nr:P-loop NTPase fold protein [Bacillus haynesii]MCY9369965.1 P-loop NTPase fold protein [Bacillus haynesii]MEC0722360.1 P-loop NTPase fold protein [Bacillus haynesii]